MKKVLISLGFAALALGATAQVKIKDGTVTGSSTTPNSNAILELESNQRGLLYPRVALQATNLSAPLPQHIKGMMVYDTVSAGDAPYTVTPGIYYNDGTQWVRASGKSDWLIFGNANSAVNGTPAGSTDSQYVTGRVAIGTNTAAAVASATSGSTAAQQTAYLTVAGGDANINGVTVGAGGGSNNVNSVAVGNQALYNNTNGTNNTAIGTGSLTANTTGFSNTAVGYQALTANQQGLQNTAVGGLALQQNVGSPSSTSIGSRNTAVGFNALNANTTGKNNTGIGYYTLSNITVDSNNIALGWAAGNAQTAGSNNIVIGYFEQLPNSTGSNQLNIGGSIFGVNMLGTAASAPTGNIMIDTIAPATVASTASGSTAAQQLAKFTVAGGDANINGVTVGMGGAQQVQNTALGYQALYNASSSIGLSTAVGYQALASMATGTGSNTAVGSLALTSNQGGQTNTAVGGRALQFLNGSNTTGIQNTAVGFDALRFAQTGQNNVAIGYEAMWNNLAGSNNTVLGWSAGNAQTAGNNNIIIGAGAQASSTTVSGEITIGGGNGTSMARVASGGSGWTFGSDRRLKHDIQPIGQGLNFVEKLKPVEYVYNNNHEGKKALGFIAQDVQQIMQQENMNPDKYTLVPKIQGDTLGLTYTEFIPILTKAIQEQQAIIEKQQTQIENLQAIIEKQQSEIDALKK